MTPEQQNATKNTIEAINSYLDILHDAILRAIMRGDDNKAHFLQQRHDEGLALLKNAVDLNVQAAIPDIKAATAVIKAQANQLDLQKKHIDDIIKSIGIITTVLDTITTVVKEVAGLVALL
jgi:hypothetical protein